ncbi:neuropeptide FF receptor 1 like 2 [Alosa sapidissima]|uniref:neuropeptide FF receptor 1 like 2 n=1 Tax=Alosa sapidissima TaxID=34773 RepID=UPI001C08C7AC|nr:neuropeptide FF receptor 1 like 2 [Alosa sapidissima]
MAGLPLPPYYQHSFPVAASLILVYLFIFLLCMVGNGLVCLIVLKNRRMRTVTNLFILNLAVSDLLVGIFCIPTTLVDNLITGWPFSNTVCKMSGLVQGMSVSASVFTLVAIAVDRFRCIVYPFQPKLTLLVAKATIGMIWVLAIMIISPSAVMLTVERMENYYMVHNEDYNHTYPMYRCFENWPDPEMQQIYTMVLFAHIYLVPLSLITLMYGRIGVKLYTTTVASAGEPHEMLSQPAAAQPHEVTRPLVSNKKIRVIKMLSMVALLFMLSWLPLWTLLLLIDYGDLNKDQLELLTGYFFPYAHWLAFSNSSVNPIIYGYYNENFKRGFQAICQTYSCCCAIQFGLRPRESSEGVQANRVYGLRNITTNTNFGARNRVHTDKDLQELGHLELEPRRKPWRHADNSESETVQGDSLGACDINNKKGPQSLENVEMISPNGARVSQAWDH